GFSGAFKVTDDFQIEGGIAVGLENSQVGGRLGGIWAFGSAPAPVYTK
ncbi:MAG: hypothetical protein JNM20_05665, partial [Rhizobiales bacterium]|nr:hypothetical protein [Hyphomicrobiales bacterium]